jgi:hypothetical protein
MRSLIAPPGSPGPAGADAAQALFQQARRRRRQRWRAGIAAVVVTGAVIAVSAVTWLPRGLGQSRSSPAALRPAALRPAALRQVPPYFAQLTDRVQVQAQAAVVRSTLTGHVLATVTPPRPYQIFTWVSAAADDRTFVLAAQRYWPIGSGQAGLPAQNRDNTTPTVFFRMTFDPATHTAKLARLAVPEKIPSAQLAGMTVSPGGTRLALDLRRSVQSIQVVTLATGTIRSWAWPGGGWIGNRKPFGQIFSWTADGTTLEFQQWNGSGGALSLSFLAVLAGALAAVVLTGMLVRRYVRVRRADLLAWTIAAATITIVLAAHAVGAYRGLAPGATNIRLLDTTAPGTSLAAAKTVLTFPDAGALGTNTLLTPDGTKIITATPQGITEFSARTGQPILSEDQFQFDWQKLGWAAGPPWQEALWASPAGQALVVWDPRGKPGRYGPGNVLGVLTGNTFTPIPHGTYDGTFLQIAW